MLPLPSGQGLVENGQSAVDLLDVHGKKHQIRGDADRRLLGLGHEGECEMPTGWKAPGRMRSVRAVDLHAQRDEGDADAEV